MNTLLFFVLGIGLLLQLLFYGVAIKLLVFRRKEKVNPNFVPAVSVVVAARNEARHLEKLIELLMRQAYPNFEVIVVNDRSTDESEVILQQLQQKYLVNFTTIHIQEKPSSWNGKKYALQQGIAAAQHELILLTDADCLPYDTQWIKYMIQPFQAQHIQAVVGVSFYETTSSNTFLNWFIRNETRFTALQYTAWANAKQTYMGVGRNLAYRKSCFEKSKGFESISSTLGGDDDLWIGQDQFKSTTAVCLQGQTYSFAPTTFKALIRQKRRHLSVGTHYTIRQKVIANIAPLGILFWYIGIGGVVFYGFYEVLALDLLRQLIIFQILRNFCNQNKQFYVGQDFFKEFFGFEILFILYYFVFGWFSVLFPPKNWK